MGLNAAVQALKKAEALKDKVQQCKDLLNDHDAWTSQQQLRKIYQQVLILDLEYALDRKVEQELWNLGFKNYIGTLQSQSKDRKNPKRGESQAMLSRCLEAASGFYLTLLQEMCTAFDLDLPFRRKSYIYGCTSTWKVAEKIPTPHKSSCLYACQYCLVHLGDIARYRNQNKQAELFYRHAVSLSPSSGQPYNQLALLEASRGDKLGTVFHYVRSVAVKHPFSVATANLAKILSAAMNDNSFNVQGKTKLTSQEYVAVFLKLHSILHNLGELSIASKYVSLLTETMTALVATESFSSWRLVQMLAINLYALQHAVGVNADSTDNLKMEQLSTDEKIARDCILDLIAGSLSALLLPIYTIKGAILEYFALPTIKLCLDWICMKPSVLEESAFTSRLQIWPSLCLLLNGLQSSVIDFKHDQYAKVPLPEDRDLQGFIPLEKAFASLQFSTADLEVDIVCLNKLRAIRILNLARELSEQTVNDSSLIIITKRDKEGCEQYTAVSETVGLSKEMWKELEELSLNKERQPLATTSPVPSESASSKGSWEMDILECTVEKRVGILKPQGSLERSRDSATSISETSTLEVNTLHSIRKPRQNVAMQAIMRRAETEQKQVTFKNSSPVTIEQENAKVVPTSPNKNTNATKIMQPNTQQHTPGQNGSANSTYVAPNSNRFSTITMPNQTQILSNQPKAPIDIQQPPTQYQSKKEAQHQTSYEGQPFNVQNPQFVKNFMTVHRSNPNQYQIPTQLTTNQNIQPQNVQIVPQNQNRAHQRNVPNATVPQIIGQNLHAQQSIASNLQQNPALQQNIRSNWLALQQNVDILQQNVGITPQSIGLQQQNVGTSQQNVGMQQQNVGMSQQNVGMPQQNVGMSQQNVGMSQQNVPMSQQNIGMSQQNVGMSQQNVGMSQQNVGMSQQNVGMSQQNVGMSQQNVGMSQQNVGMPQQNVGMSQQNVGMSQQNVGMPQQNVGMSQQNVGMLPQNIGISQQSNARVGRVNIQGQINSALSEIVNDVQGLPNLGSYQAKNYQQTNMSMSNPSNPPTSLSNAPNMNYNQNFGQNALNQLYQKQISPAAYNATAGHFNFPNRTGTVAKPPPPPVPTGNYQRFNAYDSKDFNLWKNNQPPQPPVTWWGNATANQGKDIHADVFQNWPTNPPPSINMFGNVPLGLGDNYHQTSIHGRQYNRNSLDEARPYEIDQKHPQSPGAGNTYSLFSGNSWGVPQQQNLASQDQQVKNRHSQQSLWSGPGPSPLERLLEQQKSLREGGT